MSFVQFDKGIEVTNDQTLLIIPFLQKDELYLIIESTTVENYTLISYNLSDSYHRNSQELNPANKITLSSATSKLFSFNNKVSLLTAKLNNKTWKATLHHLETDTNLASWKPIPQSTLVASDTMFDIENYTAFSHKADGVTTASVINDHIAFHTFF